MTRDVRIGIVTTMLLVRSVSLRGDKQPHVVLPQEYYKTLAKVGNSREIMGSALAASCRHQSNMIGQN